MAFEPYLTRNMSIEYLELSILVKSYGLIVEKKNNTRMKLLAGKQKKKNCKHNLKQLSQVKRRRCKIMSEIKQNMSNKRITFDNHFYKEKKKSHEKSDISSLFFEKKKEKSS